MVATRTKPRLSRDAIVTMGIAMTEQNGLAGLSARRLAAQLGCEAMSLYRHVASMDDLMDAMVDHLLGAVAPPPGVEPGAIPIARAADAWLDLAQHFPNSFELIATRPWLTPNAIATARAHVDRFVALGQDDDRAVANARVLSAYLNGAGLALAATRLDNSPATFAVRADLEAGLQALLASLAPETPAESSGEAG
jgi:AcrR family transcriptional regulator